MAVETGRAMRITPATRIAVQIQGTGAAARLARRPAHPHSKLASNRIGPPRLEAKAPTWPGTILDLRI